MKGNPISISVIIGLLTLLLFTACTQEQKRPYDVTQDDIFSIANITSTDIAVKGVGLGDTKDSMIAKLGKPDKEVKFDGLTIINVEYGKSLGMDDTGLVFQLDNGKITRITVKKPFSVYLHGKTVLNFTKEDLYFRILGIPDRQEQNPWFRVLHYDLQGIEVFMEKSANGFALRYPGATPPQKKMLTQEQIDALMKQGEQQAAEGDKTQQPGDKLPPDTTVNSHVSKSQDKVTK